MNALTVSQIAKLDKHEGVITRGQQTFVDVGNSLCAIRDEKLYLRDYDTFEAYCQGRWGWSRRRSNQLINAAELVDNLPPTLAAKVENERDARALLALEPAEQKQAIRDAHKEGIPIVELLNQRNETPVNIDSNEDSQSPLSKNPIKTDLDPPKKAKSFQEKPAAIGRTAGTGVPVAPKAKEPKPPRTDCFNRTIPTDVIPDWDRAHEIGNELRALVSRVKLAVEKGVKDRDLAFLELSNGTVSDAEGLRYTLTQILPGVVCPGCQGRARTKCLTCRGRGWISKFLYDSPAIDKAIKTIIEKGANK